MIRSWPRKRVKILRGRATVTGSRPRRAVRKSDPAMSLSLAYQRDAHPKEP
jgi:hypothetical protein